MMELLFKNNQKAETFITDVRLSSEPLTTFEKSSIMDFRLGFKYASQKQPSRKVLRKRCL